MANLTPSMLNNTSLVGLKRVYDVVVQEANSPSQPHRPPPFELLVYAARSILRDPTLLLDQIPDLLVLLASIEKLREKLAKAAASLRVTDISDVDGRTQAEEDPVQYLRTQNATLRGALRTIVNKLAYLHIHTLLRTSVLASSANKPEPKLKPEDQLCLYFPDYLGHIFPKPQDPLGKACWYLFHDGLSDSEKAALSKEAEEAVELVVDLAQYMDDPGVYAAELGLSPDKATFDDCFIRTIEPADLGDTIEWYLGEVQSIVGMIRAEK